MSAPITLTHRPKPQTRPNMLSYKSMLVNFDIDGCVSTLAMLAERLAKDFDARLMGLCAAEIPVPLDSADGMAFDPKIFQRQREDIERLFKAHEAQFRELVGAGPHVQWRADIANPTRSLIGYAHETDLIITASPEGASIGNAYRSTDLGNLILNAGRPVLIAASGAERIRTNRILVAWKDTRESRRAVADALPLLCRADEVVIATIDPDADAFTKGRLANVASFLGRHGINARTEIIRSKADGDRISEFARSIQADLVVCGAYGHSRFREWIFGGVTRSLLNDDGLNRFMSN
jgi:nucleotide-binding universal stress UspA family protein